MITISSKQRKYLEKCAHNLEPVVIIGGNGVTDSVVSAIDKALNDHELIKVKFNEFKKERQELSQKISEQLDVLLVRVIGNIAVFYRENEEEDKRQYKLPNK